MGEGIGLGHHDGGHIGRIAGVDHNEKDRKSLHFEGSRSVNSENVLRCQVQRALLFPPAS